MRLLNVFSLRLEQFFEDQIPHYAILSHTWEDEEVTFQDMQNGHGPSRKGWQKIESCCKLVRERGNQKYVWIDTCCIDKTNSSELTESINSMFDWYARSRICYAYLKDVPHVRHDPLLHNKLYDLDLPFRKSFDLNFAAAFRRSRWFTRGWTLQELLTPEFVVFLNSGWTAITTKQLSVQIIQEVTGIEPQYLHGRLNRFSRATIAKKMCWASGRQTTRKEDLAYSLLGLFGINMPLLYGEGENAFLRLQLEILKVSDDESIFAWQGENNGNVLAPTPSCFRGFKDAAFEVVVKDRPEYTMTQKGLRAELRLVREETTGSDVRLLAPLNIKNSQGQLAMILQADSRVTRYKRYCRTAVCSFDPDDVTRYSPSGVEVVYVSQDLRQIYAQTSVFTCSVGNKNHNLDVVIRWGETRVIGSLTKLNYTSVAHFWIVIFNIYARLSFAISFAEDLEAETAKLALQSAGFKPQLITELFAFHPEVELGVAMYLTRSESDRLKFNVRHLDNFTSVDAAHKEVAKMSDRVGLPSSHTDSGWLVNYWPRDELCVEQPCSECYQY